jgi:hypothetical protein
MISISILEHFSEHDTFSIQKRHEQCSIYFCKKSIPTIALLTFCDSWPVRRVFDNEMEPTVLHEYLIRVNIKTD